MMTTTITREERERVCELLGLDLNGRVARALLAGQDEEVLLDPNDIDRVAQALRDAAGEARAFKEQWDALDGNSPGYSREKAAIYGKQAAEWKARALCAEQALRDAAPQWREVTETEPAIGVSALVWPQGEAEPEVANRHERGWWNCADGNLVMPEPTHWMPLPAPPEAKPAPAPAPQSIAQPGASEAARIEALERTVAELALAVERLSGGAK